MTDQNIKDLAASITLQAVKDYFDKPKQQKAILKDLRSPWMDMLTNGMSVLVAEQIEKHPDEIAQRIRYMH